jgi:hypothetical protein
MTFSVTERTGPVDQVASGNPDKARFVSCDLEKAEATSRNPDKLRDCLTCWEELKISDFEE